MSSPSVVVLDYGSGNLRSAQRALARAGASVVVTADLSAARAADGLAVPGVGAFAACMEGIEAIGAGPVIRARVTAGRPVLGICVGMQRLHADVLPHMGWNTVSPPPGSVLFEGVTGERFYFVHSYAARPAAGDTTAEHGEAFAAATERGALCSTQFHPEKSGDAGAHLLRNWVGTL